jgi:hypothetical protein
MVLTEDDYARIYSHQPLEIQRQIPLDAATNDSWAESATKKESGTSKGNPPPTWGDLVSRRILGGQTETVIGAGVLHRNAVFVRLPGEASMNVINAADFWRISRPGKELPLHLIFETVPHLWLNTRHLRFGVCHEDWILPT